MKDFHYIVHTTTGDNVGVIQAESEDDANKKLAEIYTPQHPSGHKWKNVSFEVITQAKHDKENERILAERKAQAESAE